MAMSESPKNGISARAVLQQCISAKLQTKPADGGCDAEFVEIGRGLVIYICFLKGASHSIVDKMVKSILGAKLSYCEKSGKRISVLDLPGDVLIVPQATLGGKLKGKLVQYHSNIDKTQGEDLYENFTRACQEAFTSTVATREHANVVKYGTYGNLQVLSIVTNGPFTHVVDF